MMAAAGTPTVCANRLHQLCIPRSVFRWVLPRLPEADYETRSSHRRNRGRAREVICGATRDRSLNNDE
ncbi:hypothetical protein AAFF_G00214110 [Aldrovandia affinis]|uniref:Uncharacterized protein n=1 Tax=Aldrovandia affinis TaxID=143900 RepID=A0AAD7RJB9_9TELE|nr:hypothetical protein AAFF_G00214110 [Aldrovandia affinis]